MKSERGPTGEIFKTVKYSRILDELGQIWELEATGTRKEFLTVPYVITIAAAVECHMNEVIDEALSMIDQTESYYLIAKTLIRLVNTNKKLEFCVEILTNGRYILKPKHELVVKINALFETRNNLVHPKTHYVPLDKEPPDSPVRMTPQMQKELEDNSLQAEKLYSVNEYHHAFWDSQKYLNAAHHFDSSKPFTGNDLLIEKT